MPEQSLDLGKIAWRQKKVNSVGLADLSARALFRCFFLLSLYIEFRFGLMEVHEAVPFVLPMNVKYSS